MREDLQGRLVAMISVPEGSLADSQSSNSANIPSDIGGRSLASHQLDFALACGASHVVIVGNSASPIALALRHRAEAAGAHFSIASGPHSLAGIIREQDGVLVMQPGLFAQSEAALDVVKMAEGEAVLTLSSAAGTAAGFERIDLERAWAGLLLLDGIRMSQLIDLPEDCDPFPALLRIALQGKMAEIMLEDKLLSDGSWTRIGLSTDIALLDSAWLARQLPKTSYFCPSDAIGSQILAACKKWLLPAEKSRVFLWAGTGIFAGISVAAGWLGYSAASFLGVAIIAVLASVLQIVNHTEHGLFSAKRQHGLRNALPQIFVFCMIFICGCLALSCSFQERIFVPLILVLAMVNLRLNSASVRYRVFADPFVIPIILSISTVYSWVGAAMQGLCVAAIAAALLSAWRPVAGGASHPSDQR